MTPENLAEIDARCNTFALRSAAKIWQKPTSVEAADLRNSRRLGRWQREGCGADSFFWTHPAAPPVAYATKSKAVEAAWSQLTREDIPALIAEVKRLQAALSEVMVSELDLEVQLAKERGEWIDRVAQDIANCDIDPSGRTICLSGEARLKRALVDAFHDWLGEGAEHMERQLWRVGCFSKFQDEAARIFAEHGFGTEDE